MTRVIIFYSFNLNLHLASLFIFILDLGIKQKILFFSASCGRIALKTCAKCSHCLVSFLPFISFLSILSDVLGVNYICIRVICIIRTRSFFLLLITSFCLNLFLIHVLIYFFILRTLITYYFILFSTIYFLR